MNSYTRIGLGVAAAVAVVLAGIALLGKPTAVGPATSPTPSSATFVSPSPGTSSNPLVGTWLAPEVTCAQQVATIEAAGYTADQMAQAGADLAAQGYSVDGFFDCSGQASGARTTNRYSIVFDGLPEAATILSARVYDYNELASPHSYRLAGDSTFELGGLKGSAWEYCLTFRYAIDADQLTIVRIDPSCTGTADAPLLDQIALTAILETSSFTRQP